MEFSYLFLWLWGTYRWIFWELMNVTFFKASCKFGYNTIRCFHECAHQFLPFIFHLFPHILEISKNILWQQKEQQPLCLARSLAESIKRVLTCLTGQTDSKHLTFSSELQGKQEISRRDLVIYFVWMKFIWIYVWSTCPSKFIFCCDRPLNGKAKQNNSDCEPACLWVCLCVT